MLDLALVLQLAVSCAPTVAPQTIAAVAMTESGFDPLALGDNTTRRSHSPASLEEAVALASRLAAAGHSIDLGLMQVNSDNLARLSLSIREAFDPCRSITAGGQVLAEAYSGGAAEPDVQAALRVALSRYNTGSPSRGFLNGYVRKVEASALQLVPALRVTAGDFTPGQAMPLAVAPPVRTPPPGEAESEWHVVQQSLPDPEAADGEWHAIATSQADRGTPARSDTSEAARAASVVLLTQQTGSHP